MISGSYSYASFSHQITSEDEDLEESDRYNIRLLIENYFKSTYPLFEPEVVTRLDGKEYFLPALKVLVRVGNDYMSPGYESKWKDGELMAICKKDTIAARANLIVRSNGEIGVDPNFEESAIYGSSHDAPDDNCECGIYGSVNIEEVIAYLEQNFKASLYQQALMGTLGSMYANLNPYTIPDAPIKNVLCLIEPSPDAKVIMCRKGWKASHAFISEIVGETISWDDAYQVLSLSWKRSIDLAQLYRVYENRRENENRKNRQDYYLP